MDYFAISEASNNRKQEMSSSILPPEPCRELPRRAQDFRFKDITLPTEWIESYRPGGFHPLDLGDTFKDGQYEMLRKLGYGSYSTVWLANDTKCVRL